MLQAQRWWQSLDRLMLVAVLLDPVNLAAHPVNAEEFGGGGVQIPVQRKLKMNQQRWGTILEEIYLYLKNINIFCTKY